MATTSTLAEAEQRLRALEAEQAAQVICALQIVNALQEQVE